VLQPGSIIGGRLRIEQVLGAGGMGIVAAATHLELGNKVAVKVLHDELAQNPTIVERFIREARSVVNLKTEHVCRVFDVGRLDNGAPYIVMEMLSGVDLQRTIATKPLPPSIAVDYLLQACVAIGEAHAAGIIHRDLKPANLFVTRRLDGGPLVKVLDFGIAKAMDAAGPHLTQTTGMMGSPGYMSPEQLMSARDVDVRTDIWALGVTLYQLLSARMPFPGPTITEIAIKVANDPPVPIDVDPDLRAVIWRCLEKQPDRRYPSVAALSADLARFASSDGRKTAGIAAQTGLQTLPVAMNAPTAAGSMMAAPMTPPPMAAVTATQAPIHTPPAHVAPSPRAKWPLIIGALALVGVTVAVMLVVTKKDSPAGVVATTPSDAAPIPDAVVVTPIDGGTPAMDATIEDASIDAEPPDEENGEDFVLTPEQEAASVEAAKGLSSMIPEAERIRMRKDCLEQLPTMKPQASAPGVIEMSRVGCFCVLGEKEKAVAELATIKDPGMRAAAKASCAMLGGLNI
jgi:serine/threonine-protein kinase